MKDWEKFEINVTEYLNKQFVSPNIRFKNMGSSDSTEPDIKVYKNDEHIFSIECKYSTSQAAQFVVHADDSDKKFKWSTKNKTNIDRCRKIIDHMDQNFLYYSSGSNRLLKLEESLMYESVIGHIKERSDFVVASDGHSNFDNNFIKIIPVDEIDKHFKISGTYRIKQSGSRSLPIKDFNKVQSEIKSIDRSVKVFRNGNKTFVQLVDVPPTKHFGENFFLSDKTNNLFEIKKTSGTRNMNVIFTLKFCPMDDRVGMDKLSDYIDLS